MNAKQVFDTAAADYDRNRRQLVPDFDAFYGTGLAQIPFAPDAAFRVLDLGAGTGLLSALAAALFPNARFTLVDVSNEMLAKARDRFAGRLGFAFQVVNLEHEALTGEYDVAISSLALHHIAPVTLPTIFRRVYDVLVSGGIFINIDQTLGTTPENERAYSDAWVRDVRAEGTSDADLAAAFERMKADKTATLEDQLRWMREAGFQHVDCWYKRYRMAVYSGRKP